MHTRVSTLACLLTGLLILANCGATARQPPPPASTAQSAAPTSAGTSLFATQAPSADATSLAATSAAGQGLDGALPVIAVDAAGAARPFDQRLLGTNLPAWMGSQRLEDPLVQQRTTALGTTVLRMPGGSWSNYYDWLACEEGNTEVCDFPVAAKPSEFIDFLRATGGEPMWTVSINGTAKEAAALVAFFNGSVDDEKSIGVDVRGRDWKTVGHWAQLRSAQGSPEPLPIRLWEVGNEVYGAKPGVGANCAPWGWEDVWTCDGAEYVLGMGSGAERREGYLEFREAMRAVDPDILVGAVGIAKPGEWSDWGNKVISNAGEQLDFYVVHLYPFESKGAQPDEVLGQPQKLWVPMMEELNAAFERHLGHRVPVAVTEYNLTAFADLDDLGLMRRAVNALYIADSIGQMAEGGVAMANQWNLANGVTAADSDYGLIDADSSEPNPAYYALQLWSRFGAELLPLSSTLPADTTLSVYAGRDSDGMISLLAINKTDAPIEAALQLDGVQYPLAGTMDSLTADALDTREVRFNGVARPAVDFADAPPTQLGPFDGPFEQTFAPFSITLLRLAPATP